MNEEEFLVYEIVNRIYYLKEKRPYSYVNMIEREINRRKKENEDMQSFIRNKISENFDKRLSKKLSKLL